MKKFFTLACMALAAMSVNAQNIDDIDPANVYEIESIVWKPITWKNGNNKEDKDKNPMYFLMGTGNGYEVIKAECFYSEDKGEDVIRACYGYINYEAGETGVPKYGLYYKFTPKVAGTLRMNVWNNKTNRKTFVVKGSTGTPLIPYVDYTFDGYVNGQNTNTDQPKIDEATGQQAVDNEGNLVWIQAPTYFTADEIKARREAFIAEQVAKNPEYTLSDYVIDCGNQAVWGWITFNVEAGESYYVYQQSSQLGFGGYDFTPTGGAVETYVASPEGGLAAEFAAVVNADGVAQNVTDEGSVVNLATANMDVKAVGGAEPESVVPVGYTPGGGGQTGIETVKTADVAGGKMYNMAGQEVADGFKGLVIVNGKKVIK